MTEKRVFRKPIRQHLMEGFAVKDRLTVENPLAKKILVDIGNGRRIRIGARRIAKKPREGCRRAEGKVMLTLG